MIKTTIYKKYTIQKHIKNKKYNHKKLLYQTRILKHNNTNKNKKLII